ncbi:hypothetical protein SCLCIDRAFT_1157339 [Scleroderma citrinum Foug A]|uniref:Zn(2)-C6 fungal-type domain-containing protein n=1 Tax=Scleroderma citrinum Foug A TaxID=1036808 RepID=A0A0C3CYN3_9AGAM|nr:hypothetical protein SCLCIDRAFT_1157339 [Scleroderma citrinum Foug A]
MAYGALAARHSLDPGSSSALSLRSAVVEYRKDGTVSKMRSHKGNIPILPQTKLCPHCPAKFTRTTHLNRHLRTHTGERLHRCDTCEAQFTRSDLLTRHKKTCGDPTHANRTRRRSCQACANSKVKCDLQQPCSKCRARGKECVFVIRPPKSSTTAKATASAAVVPEHSADPVDHLVSKLSTPPTALPVISPVAARTTTDASAPPDHLGQSSYDWNASVVDQMENRPEELSFSSDGPSPSPSEAISSTSDACHPNSHPEPVHHQVNAFYSNEVFEPFFPNIIPGYNAVSVDHDNSRNQTQQAFPSAEHTQRSYYTEDNFIPQHTASVDVRYQAFAEQQHYRLVDPTTYVRNRVKTASPYSASGGMWRASCEGLTKTQLHYHYPPKSAECGVDFEADPEQVKSHTAAQRQALYG